MCCRRGVENKAVADAAAVVKLRCWIRGLEPHGLIRVEKKLRVIALRRVGEQQAKYQRECDGRVVSTRNSLSLDESRCGGDRNAGVGHALQCSPRSRFPDEAAGVIYDEPLR